MVRVIEQLSQNPRKVDLPVLTIIVAIISYWLSYFNQKPSIRVSPCAPLALPLKSKTVFGAILFTKGRSIYFIIGSLTLLFRRDSPWRCRCSQCSKHAVLGSRIVNIYDFITDAPHRFKSVSRSHTCALESSSKFFIPALEEKFCYNQKIKKKIQAETLQQKSAFGSFHKGWWSTESSPYVELQI